VGGGRDGTDGSGFLSQRHHGKRKKNSSEYGSLISTVLEGQKKEVGGGALMKSRIKGEEIKTSERDPYLPYAGGKKEKKKKNTISVIVGERRRKSLLVGEEGKGRGTGQKKHMRICRKEKKREGRLSTGGSNEACWRREKEARKKKKR